MIPLHARKFQTCMNVESQAVTGHYRPEIDRKFQETGQKMGVLSALEMHAPKMVVQKRETIFEQVSSRIPATPPVDVT